MKSFEIENQLENKDILDPDPMYFDFLEKQDKSTWEFEEALNLHLVPDTVIAGFIQEYLQKNNFRHLDIYKWCLKHKYDDGQFFANILLSYYRDLINGKEISDVAKEAFQIVPGDVNTIFHEVIESDRQKEEKKKLQERGVFFINGSEVIPKEKLVKFPEYLVKETGGVEGYLRRELTWQELDNIFSKILSIGEIKNIIDQFFSLIPENIKKFFDEDQNEFKTLENINSLESFEAFESMIYFVKNNILSEGYYSRYYSLRTDKGLNEMFGREKISQLGDKIIRLVSMLKNIIDMFGDNFMDRENIHVMSLYHGPGFESFSDTMLKQKIFDPEIDESVKSGGTQDYGYTVFSIDSDATIQRVERMQSYNASDYEKLSTYLENGDFLVHGFGLSVTEGGIWDLDKNRRDPELAFNTYGKPKFGFSEQNKAFKRYMCSLKELFDKQNGIVKEAIIASPKNPFYFQTNPPHPLIPIVMGHPGIPDLRWCHASHAYIPTKNGISILKMISTKDEMMEEENRLKDKIKVGKEE